MGLTRPTVAQLNTVVTEISDPISVLNKGSTLANVDIGFVFNRDGGVSANAAFYWNETTDAFNLVTTTSTGGVNSNISIGAYADLRIWDLTGNTASFSGTGAIKIPTGNTLQRTSGTTGEIRFNTSTSQFEGYQGTSWSSLGGVRSVDNQTYILAELSPGAGGNILYFYTGGTLSANLGLTTGLTVGNINLNNNTISSTDANGNIVLDPAGTGTIQISANVIPTSDITYDLGSSARRFNKLWLAGNTIYLGNAAITSVGNDVIITNTGSFGVPVGTTEQRTSVQGAIRYNTTTSKFETFDGAAWNSLAYGTLSDFPTGDYGDVTTVTTDAFGVPSATTFDCNSEGAVLTTDLGVLT